MSVGQIFASLPIAAFWLAFVWIVAFMVNSPALQQNEFLFWVIVSFIPILFLLNLTGTIMLLRYIKNWTWTWDKKIEN